MLIKTLCKRKTNYLWLITENAFDKKLLPAKTAAVLTSKKVMKRSGKEKKQNDVLQLRLMFFYRERFIAKAFSFWLCAQKQFLVKHYLREFVLFQCSFYNHKDKNGVYFIGKKLDNLLILMILLFYFMNISLEKM